MCLVLLQSGKTFEVSKRSSSIFPGSKEVPVLKQKASCAAFPSHTPQGKAGQHSSISFAQDTGLL